MKENIKLEYIDWLGNAVDLIPRLELYTVEDILGREMPGLAIVLSEENGEMFDVLTVSFGEMIALRDCAYVDTNNLPGAEDMLRKSGIAEETRFTHQSGFCTYPLWHFNPEFLKAIGKKNYEKYCKAYDKYYAAFAS